MSNGVPAAHTRSPKRAATIVLAFASLLVALALPSPAHAQRRQEQRTKEDIKEEGRRVFNRETADPNRRTDGGAYVSDGKWSIAVMSLRGPERDEAAPIALARIRAEGRLPEAFAERRSSATIIAVGKFDSPDDPQAQRELRRIQEILVNGVPAYSFAFLCPPEAEPKFGAHPEYNLLRAKETFGSAAIQTLQVGVYARDDLKNPTEKDLAEVRRLAESAAVKLRQEGELAFYYHGPRRSMVTIGVFDISDFDPQIPGYNSPRLVAAKRRHPHNLYNGQGIRERNPQDGTSRLQPSTLVAIPDPPPQPRRPADHPPAQPGAAPQRQR
ncbi:MAG: hypothetical protein KF768_03765 [Phycisphaeraceae bacterium]|nr:hypothetical protein [Phycisphaeraceae bacterium]